MSSTASGAAGRSEGDAEHEEPNREPTAAAQCPALALGRRAYGSSLWGPWLCRWDSVPSRCSGLKFCQRIVSVTENKRSGREVKLYVSSERIARTEPVKMLSGSSLAGAWDVPREMSSPKFSMLRESLQRDSAPVALRLSDWETGIQPPKTYILQTEGHSDVELGGAEAGVGHGGVGLPRRGAGPLRLREAPASGPRHRLQLQLVEVTQGGKPFLGALGFSFFQSQRLA
ncbi:hypothetical protein EYF80_059601 [Liparis tanakae]|uniref:Uncharacterized protein n=1 Tax=Liparis tanakae TaxID=230148 RepID=A0A4Z2EN89_9TELE|nr:hypothetical protein EYF80_059601 [Liparis tanakae]